MSTIPLNDALKAQKFDTVSLTTANVDELTTAPGTIYLGSVTLENNFPKYMTIGDPDGGNLCKGANGKLFATSQLVRDSSILVGDAQTELFNTYDGNKNLFAAPAFYNTNVVLSTVATTPCTRTTTTIGGQTVYQTYYETGSLGTNANVDTVTWYFQNPNNVFRVIITELSSGTITYLSTAEDKFLAGEGITCTGSGAQTWNAIVPAIWRKGLNYSVVAQSLSPDFNIMGSYSGSTFIPYAIFTGWLADVQSVVHLPLWSAGTWNAGDVVWNLDTVVGSIYSGGPLCRGNAYVCLVTGAQTGTFASNLSAGKWRKIQEHASLYARRNSTAQSITKLTDTPVLFDTENTLNEYLPTHTGLTYSGGVFTNTSGGEVVVHVSYNFVYNPNNVGDRWSWVRLNGQNGKRLCFSSASSINNVPIGCAGSFNLYMASGDYFEVMTRHSSNISINLDGAAAGIDAGYSTRISIMRVQ